MGRPRELTNVFLPPTGCLPPCWKQHMCFIPMHVYILLYLCVSIGQVVAPCLQAASVIDGAITLTATTLIAIIPSIFVEYKYIHVTYICI